MTRLRIAARFSGPPRSANGGVTAGLLAQHVGGALPGSAVEVTLRRPPPLETDLAVEDGRLLHGDVVVAEARASALDVAPPPSVGLDRARAAMADYAGLRRHPFPGCFVCGTERPDGLGLHPGAVGDGLVATAWERPDADPVMVWAALDCPGGWSSDLEGRPSVLGRITARVDAPPDGEACVVQGWLLGVDGRKTHTASAVYGADGAVLAVARATWLAVDLEALPR